MPSNVQTIRFFALRIFLGLTALGWGICVAGVLVPSSMAFEFVGLIADVDTTPFESDPMFDYWLRMASSVFALVGLGYLGLAIWPTRFAIVLPFAGAFMILEGLVLLIHGLRLGLDPVPFLGDTTFCLAGGIGILGCMGSGRSNTNPKTRNLEQDAAVKESDQTA